jgi:hypothetical protein
MARTNDATLISTSQTRYTAYHSMFQPEVNVFLTKCHFPRRALVAIVFMLTACAPTLQVPHSPWHVLQEVAEAAPHDQPALWSDGEKTLIAWPGEPAAPGIRLADLQKPGEAKVLPLGRVPWQVSLLPAADGYLHILWLDQTLPGETHLVGALIDTYGGVIRSPGIISNRPTAQYTSVSQPSGDVLTLWTEVGDRPALYVQKVDGQGRPGQERRLAQPATNPGGAVDSNGNFHIFWLEPGAGSFWTIHYTILRRDGTNSQSIPIGVIRTIEGQTLESFRVGADKSNLYCLWSLTATTNKGPLGGIAGLTFPFSDDSAVKSLAFDSGSFKDLSLHWPTLPAQVWPSLTISLTASSWDGRAWRDVPAAVVLSPNGPGDLHPVYDFTADNALVTRTAISTTSDTILAWTVLRPNGTAAVYYAR